MALAPETIQNRSCVSWTPGLANFQMAGGKVFFPKQRGVRLIGGVDAYEASVALDLGFDPVFVDDWQLYHLLMGEVHCGSNVRRERYAFDRWDRPP